MDVPKLKNDTMRSRFKKENCNPFHLSWSLGSSDSRCQIKMRINAKPKGGNEVSSVDLQNFKFLVTKEQSISKNFSIQRKNIQQGFVKWENMIDNITRYCKKKIKLANTTLSFLKILLWNLMFESKYVLYFCKGKSTKLETSNMSCLVSLDWSFTMGSRNMYTPCTTLEAI